MSTHIEANIGDIADTVLMPGDPLRAKYIAEKFLIDVKQINSVRNMFGYTGYYKGKRVSITGSGMGIPSMGIYSYELFKKYDVDTIIRIGTAGSYLEDLDIFDVVLVESCYSDSNYAFIQSGCKETILYPDQDLNNQIEQCANEMKLEINKRRIYSSDVYIREKEVDNMEMIIHDKGCSCVEMESFSLFHNAKLLNKKASCLLTISDSACSKKKTSFSI